MLKQFFSKIFGAPSAQEWQPEAQYPQVHQALTVLAAQKQPMLAADKKEALSLRIDALAEKLKQKPAAQEVPNRLRQPHLVFATSFALLVLVLSGSWLAIPAPKVLGSERTQDQLLARNADIRVVFTQAMDHASVQEAFQITPALPGNFSWEKNMLRFNPSQDLQKGDVYEVVVKDTARSIFQKRLATPFRQRFLVTDYPQLSVIQPVKDTEISTDQLLTVAFTAPIRNLTHDLSVPQFLRITPVVEGTYRWLGTAAFEFIPKNGWPKAQEINVVLPKGTKFSDGSETVEEYAWSFRTAALAVVQVNRQHNAAAQAPITWSFNYPVNTDAFLNALTMVDQSSKQELGVRDIFNVEKKEEAMQEIKLIPKQPLKLGTSYLFTLPKGWNGNLGNRGLTQDFAYTVVMPASGFSFAKLCTPASNLQTYEGAYLQFNNLPDEESAKAKITVSPTPKNLEIMATTYGSYQHCAGEGSFVQLYANWSPETSYTVTIAPELQDIHTQKLGAAKTVTFTTAPYRPAMQISAGYAAQGLLAHHMPRLYQARTLNIADIGVSLCQISMESYRTGSQNVPCVKQLVDTIMPIQAPRNTYQVTNLDLDTLAGEKLENGFYKLTVKADELDQWDREQSYLVAINDIALMSKYAEEAQEVLVWAVDMETGKPLANVALEAFGDIKNKERIASAITDEDGLARLKVSNITYTYYFIRATQGTKLGVISGSWRDGISAWNFGLSEGVNKGDIGYIYTDRRIYRPGQEVFIKGVIRSQAQGKLEVPTYKNATVTVRNARGEQIYSQALPMSQFGTFATKLTLPEAAPTGSYQIAVLEGKNSAQVVGNFEVAEYRLPDFKLGITTPSSVVKNQSLTMQVRATYYHGAPLAGGKVTYSVIARNQPFQPMMGEWYSFSENEDGYCWYWCYREDEARTIVSGEGNIDSSGNFSLAIPTDLKDAKESATYFVEVTVQDVNNRTVTQRQEVMVHRAQSYVGIRANYSKGWNAKTLDFDLISVNPDGTELPNVNAVVSLMRREWTTVQKVGSDGIPFRESQKKDIPVDEKTVRFVGNGKGQVSFTVKDAGEYIATISTKDKAGNTVAASTGRYVSGGSFVYAKETDDQVLKLLQNKASYKPGETAELLVDMPWDGGEALLTVERENVKSAQRIVLTKGVNTVRVAITPDMVPNVFVSLTAVKTGAGQVPELRVGYANLQVDTEGKEMNLSVSADKQTYQPGDTVTLSIDAKNKNGNPVDAEVSIAVVDERVTALVGSIDKNILGKFYFPRTLGVRTAHALTVLVKKIFQDTEGGSGKGGDDNNAIRGNFQDTAFWQAQVATGADGKATLSFKLPDNLTSWQILAIGTTKDTIVGAAEAKITTQKPLMAEPLMPRFLRQQDQVQLGATIFNNQSTEQSITVSVQGTGLQWTAATARKVTIAPGNRLSVLFPATVLAQATQASIIVTAESASAKDAFSVTLPVKANTIPEIVSVGNILNGNATETVEVPEGVQAGHLKVEVSPHVGAMIAESAKVLEEVEGEGNEEKAAQLLALALRQELKRLNAIVLTPAQEAEEKAKAQKLIAALVSYQQSSGGWSWYRKEHGTRSTVTNTVYQALKYAQMAGWSVDAAGVTRAENYLRSILANPPQEFTNEERVQILETLTQFQSGNIGSYSNKAYQDRSELSNAGLAKLMAILARTEGAQNPRLKTLKDTLANQVVYLDTAMVYLKEENQNWWANQNTVTASAAYMNALLEADPENENIERLLMYLVRERQNGAWNSMEATLEVVRAATRYTQKYPVPKNGTMIEVFHNSAPEVVMEFKDAAKSSPQSFTRTLQELVAQGSVHQYGFQKAEGPRAFYHLTLSVTRAAQNIAPWMNGFQVTNEYYALDDTKFERPLQQVKMGEFVRTRVVVIAIKRHRNVLLQSALPAGLEAVDESLSTAYQDDAEEEYGDEEWWNNPWTYTEFRDDKVVRFAEFLDPGIYEYTYIAQAIAPGTFQVPPAQVEEKSNPAQNAHNEGKNFTVMQ